MPRPPGYHLSLLHQLEILLNFQHFKVLKKIYLPDSSPLDILVSSVLQEKVDNLQVLLPAVEAPAGSDTSEVGTITVLLCGSVVSEDPLVCLNEILSCDVEIAWTEDGLIG